VQRFDALQLSDYLKTNSPLLIDVREPWEFDICHIDNSQLKPMGQIPQQIDYFQDAGECVIICHHGVRSLQVIRYLEHYKIEHLINLDGGIDAWANQVDLNMSKY